MLYEFEDHSIAVRDCCDIVRDKLEEEYDYDEIAKPVSYIVGDLMGELYDSSDNGLVDPDKYGEQVTEQAVVEGIKRTMELDDEIYSDDDIEEIAEYTIEAFQSWYYD